MIEAQDRRARLAAALEEQFDRCNALSAALSHDGKTQLDDIPLVLSLMRTCAQHSAMIAKLDGTAPEKSKNGGSIPQENSNAV